MKTTSKIIAGVAATLSLAVAGAVFAHPGFGMGQGMGPGMGFGGMGPGAGSWAAWAPVSGAAWAPAWAGGVPAWARARRVKTWPPLRPPARRR